MRLTKKFVGNVFRYYQYYSNAFDFNTNFRQLGGYTIENAEQAYHYHIQCGLFGAGDSGYDTPYFAGDENENGYEQQVYETGWNLHCIAGHVYLLLQSNTLQLINILKVNKEWYKNERKTKSAYKVRDEILTGMLFNLSINDWELTKGGFKVVKNRATWHKLLGDNLSSNYIYIGGDLNL